MSKNKHSISDLIIYILSAETAGALSALLSGGFSDFFTKYEKPPLLPPSLLFPIVWTILYALMGISAYLISISDAKEIEKRRAMELYWIQLAVNFSWSIVFFRFEALWAAAVLILVLLALIAAMILRFWKICPAAGKINIPYLLWVTFASYLTIAIAVLN